MLFKGKIVGYSKNGVRVIKHNRGSTAEGIWQVEVLEAEKCKSKIPLDAKLKLGNYDLPLIWTADFMLDTDKKTGTDKYVLEKINASCVVFTTFLELSENIADEVLALLDAEEAVNSRWAAFKK